MKINLYGQITDEMGVVCAFAKLHEELGFPKLVPSKSRGFDIDDIEYKNGERVTVEFEFTSDNFINHGHVEQMKEGRHYIVVCYEDNCNIVKKVREEYAKDNLSVIELKKYIEYKEDVVKDEEHNIQYFVLSYNPAKADKKTIDEFAKTNMYGLNSKFENDYIVPGSKILFKQGNYIVAECSVVRYEQFDLPKTENEWKLYKCLYQYPFGIFTGTQEDMEKYFNKGYIFYDEFHVFKERLISFKETLPERNMSYDGKIKITKEEYNKLTGK